MKRVASRLGLAAAAPIGLFLLVSCGQSPVDESVRSGTEAATAAPCVYGQECCPTNYRTVTLTQNAETYAANAANQCVVALGGSDTIVANLANPIVLAGPGDDTIMAGPNSLVRGGDGRDTVNVWGGPSIVYGGTGDDTINAANGDNLVVPGPGNDTVATGTGNDTVALYDMCEISGGVKTLDGGSGSNTLITPVPLAQLKTLGYKISNFQKVVVQANSCKSECVTQPDCSGHGTCAEGATAGTVQCQCDPAYQGAKCDVKRCASNDDTDHDGEPDCRDLCPYDPLKTLPGICGCNKLETDTDGDGTPDCIEPACAQDPNNTSPGECGCVGSRTLKPKGTVCTDKACPLPAGSSVFSTCDGVGVCGDRSGCNPSTVPGACPFVDFQGTSYYVCGAGGVAGLQDGGVLQPPGQLTETQAELACTAKGMTLSRINSLEQQRFFARIIGTPLWLGANDLTAANNWRWSAPNTNDGDVFWTGGATGKPVPGRFTYWASGAPGAQRCATMRVGDGRWVDTNCTEKHGFMCQYATPSSGPGFPPRGPSPDGGTGGGGSGVPGQPLPFPHKCVPETQSLLPGIGHLADLQSDHDQAQSQNFVGAGANKPPNGSPCVNPDPGNNAVGLVSPFGGGCTAKNIQKGSRCSADSDCAGFGTGYLCRQIQTVDACKTPDAGSEKVGGGCIGNATCMQVQCVNPDPTLPCDEIDICDPGTEFTPTLDQGANLDAGTYDPAKAFVNPPDAGSTGTYQDTPDPDLVGPAHTWCSMKPQHPVAAASQGPGGFTGHIGGTGKLQFKFDPDLQFEINPSPLALGEVQAFMHAEAKLGASVKMADFLGAHIDQPILVASAGISIDRCSINTQDSTKFQIFGVDFMPLSALGIPIINSNGNSPLSPATQACKASLANFTVAADRAKKSFRDAQQLLYQYSQAQKAGKTLPPNLCTTLGVNTARVPNFPGGNACPAGETVETTINRFVDYYQKDGSGELTHLRQAASGLRGATTALQNALFNDPNVSLQFADTHGDESQTIANVPFAIGPIPMVLQIDVFATYGITGNFDVGIDFPLSLDLVAPEQPVTQSMAHVKASVVPYAQAGLSAFVGAGVSLGPLTAALGLEGALSLADVKAPIFAGAELGVSVQQDPRPVPVELLPPVSVSPTAFQLGGAKSYKFYAGYDYGAGVDLVNVLGGVLNARLTIKFFFFSRTWRKQIVKFNGWFHHYNLVQGGSKFKADDISSSTPETAPTGPETDRTTTNVASGETPQGLGEAQVPLMVLQPILTPSKFTATQSFNATQVQGMFYDSLCCLKTGETCSLNDRPTCCPGERCNVAPQQPDASVIIASGTCVIDCHKPGTACQTDVDCCQDPATDPNPRYCGTQHTCRSCGGTGSTCAEARDCCFGDCVNKVCTEPSPL